MIDDDSGNDLIILAGNNVGVALDDVLTGYTLLEWRKEILVEFQLLK